MDDVALAQLLSDTAEAVTLALDTDLSRSRLAWREKGERPGQYRIDLVANEAALAVLRNAGVGVLSEESGLEGAGRDIVVVIDPVDGSTNASRGIPWYATSLCAVDSEGPRASLVANLATGTTYQALRGKGAYRDGHRIEPSSVTKLDDAMVVLNGYSPSYLEWRQYRSLGATALDLCCVADGTVDATIDCTENALGAWDYMGAMLVLEEAGGSIADQQGRDLVVLDHGARRTPVSAATPKLFELCLAARREMPKW